MGDIDTELRRVHRELLELRSFERLLIESDFKSLINERSDEEKKKVIEMLKNKDRQKLLNWIRAQNKDLETLGVRDLRKLASRYQILRYGTMTKRELIVSIRRHQDEKETRTNDGIDRRHDQSITTSQR